MITRRTAMMGAGAMLIGLPGTRAACASSA